MAMRSRCSVFGHQFVDQHGFRRDELAVAVRLHLLVEPVGVVMAFQFDSGGSATSRPNPTSS